MSHLSRQSRILVFGVALAVAGCGAGRLIVSLDLASFLPGDVVSRTYGVSVPIPPQQSVTMPITAETVVTPDGLGSVAEVEEADLEVRAVFDNQSGRATGQLWVRFAPAGEDPNQVPPGAILEFELQPGEVSIAEETIPLTETVRNLFLDGSFELALEIRFTTEGTESLSGSFRLEVLKARVTANPSLLS